VVALRQPLVRVTFQHSYFLNRWALILEAVDYILEKVPEFYRQPASLAWAFGRIAFGHAVLGHAKEARTWAMKSIKLNWRQPLGYIATLVSYRILSPKLVFRLAHATGRGV
jgi:hypothetical protein